MRMLEEVTLMASKLVFVLDEQKPFLEAKLPTCREPMEAEMALTEFSTEMLDTRKVPVDMLLANNWLILA